MLRSHQVKSQQRRARGTEGPDGGLELRASHCYLAERSDDFKKLRKYEDATSTGAGDPIGTIIHQQEQARKQREERQEADRLKRLTEEREAREREEDLQDQMAALSNQNSTAVQQQRLPNSPRGVGGGARGASSQWGTPSCKSQAPVRAGSDPRGTSTPPMMSR